MLFIWNKYIYTYTFKKVLKGWYPWVFASYLSTTFIQNQTYDTYMLKYK